MDWLRSYWRWTTAGSKLRLAAGLGGPILALLVLLGAVSGGSDDGESCGATPQGKTPTPTAAEAATPAPPSSAPGEEGREAAAPPGGPSAASTLPAVAPGQGLLYVYFFDVSLGDAVYVRTPSGEDVIIDGGDSRDELSAFLDQLGETAVDVIVASHPHADHIRGLPRGPGGGAGGGGR